MKILSCFKLSQKVSMAADSISSKFMELEAAKIVKRHASRKFKDILK
jgi:hypothetical protein